MHYGSSMEDKSWEGSSSLRYVSRLRSSVSSRPSKRLWGKEEGRVIVRNLGSVQVSTVPHLDDLQARKCPN